MMARSHALSGAAGWLTAAALSTAAGLPWTPSTVLVGTVVAAGSAMLPDIDCPDSHAGRSLGPITNRLARAVAAGSHRVYERTATPLDRSDRYRRGHRGVTHTIPVAVALGLAVTVLAFTPAGPAVSGVVLFFTATLAARGLLSWKTRHVWVGPRRGLRVRVEWAPWVGVLVALDLLLAGHPGAWWWLGVPVAAGMVLHDLGDTPTHHADYPPETSGIPLLWPFVVRGQRWYRVRPPAAVMFPVGSVTERVCAFGFTAIAVAAAAAWLVAYDALAGR
jgi:membrane-bound metal-dependent hydrolase YbcI (DUF457 family)